MRIALSRRHHCPRWSWVRLVLAFSALSMACTIPETAAPSDNGVVQVQPPSGAPPGQAAGVRQLTSSSHVGDVAISGSKIAFVDRTRTGEWTNSGGVIIGFNYNDLRLYDLNTGASRMLLAGAVLQSIPAIAHSGQLVAWSSHDGVALSTNGVWFMDVDVGTPMLVSATGFDPELSGARVAYRDTRNGGLDLYVLDTGTMTERHITPNLSFSAFDIDGSVVTWLERTDDLVRWADVSDPGLTVHTLPVAQAVHVRDLKSSGNLILLQATIPGGWNGELDVLFVLDRTTGVVTEVGRATDDPNFYFYLDSPDISASLAIWVNHNFDTGQEALMAKDVFAPTAPQQIHDAATREASIDGTGIAFRAWDGNSSELFFYQFRRIGGPPMPPPRPPSPPRPPRP